jgi:hypothetical protein
MSKPEISKPEVRQLYFRVAATCLLNLLGSAGLLFVSLRVQFENIRFTLYP